MKQNGLSLEYAAHFYQNETNVVYEASLQKPMAFRYASQTIKQNKKLIINIMNKPTTSILEHVDSSLYDNKEVIL